MKIAPTYQPPADLREPRFSTALLENLNFSLCYLAQNAVAQTSFWKNTPTEGLHQKLFLQEKQNETSRHSIVLKQEAVNNPTHFAHLSRPVSVPSHEVTQNLLQLSVLHFVCFKIPNEIQSQVNKKTDTVTPQL